MADLRSDENLAAISRFAEDMQKMLARADALGLTLVAAHLCTACESLALESHHALHATGSGHFDGGRQ